jgi:NAD-dependent dihydropyrimidine dehydrogenase PreA subunit
VGVGNLTGEATMEDRRADNCKGAPETVAPVIDRNRCEAKAGCVEVCPFDVFEVRALASSDRAMLNMMGKLKAWAHGNRQAYVIRPADCRACQLCIKACPEGAIRLAPFPPP